jgi:hypothetical protein
MLRRSAWKATSLKDASLLLLVAPCMKNIVTVRFGGERRLCSKEKRVFYGGGGGVAAVAVSMDFVMLCVSILVVGPTEVIVSDLEFRIFASVLNKYSMNFD